MHVVASTSVTDYFSGTTLTSEYLYHHGYWDGADREFRGFARVDQRDTLTPTGPRHAVLQPADRDSHLVPPGPGRPRKRVPGPKDWTYPASTGRRTRPSPGT